MKSIAALFLLLCLPCFAADDALRSLLGVQSRSFEVPKMSKAPGTKCAFRVMTFVKGVAKDTGYMSFEALGGGQKMEVLWQNSGDKTKILFSRDGMTAATTIDKLPEGSIGSTSFEPANRPVVDGWTIVAFWAINNTDKSNAVFAKLEDNIKSHNYVLAIGVREIAAP